MKIYALLIFIWIAIDCYARQETTNMRAENSFRFDFGTGKVQQGYLQVQPETGYTPERGYGFEPRSKVVSKNRKGSDDLSSDFITASSPFYFSIKVPEGNYRVKVTLGDDKGTSDAVIRAESRRMMVNRVQIPEGQHQTLEFTVHVRDSLIAGTHKKVRLKEREYNYFHWDEKLTLEFNGENPKVNAIEILPEQEEVITLFLAGNSTVVDGAYEPYSAWGQMVPVFFQPGKVAVANYAESGESLSSFIAERRLEKILSLMKPGDYAFVEFGHNDQKQKGPGVGAFTTYKKDLTIFIDEVRKKGGIPVLVTPVQRRSFDDSANIIETLGDYPEAVRQTAKEENVALIDLNAMSKILYETWGPDASINAFVHFPPNTFPGQSKALADNTHFRPYGAYEIAKLIIKGIKDSDIGLEAFLLEDFGNFDPSKPGSYELFYWPHSPRISVEKPDGN